MSTALRLDPSAVVVGIDGSEESIAALRWAVDHREAGQTVFAVLAYQVPGVRYPGLRTVDEDIEAAERTDLEKALIEALGPDYRSKVESELIYGYPKTVLRDLSNEADQIVVGAQGHNAILDGALGSISAYLVAHAGCPVTVVRKSPSTK